MQDALDSAYTSLARELGALLAPVGPAWQRALVDSPQLRLYQKDDSHPAPLGTYLAACVSIRSSTASPPSSNPAVAMR
jgi:hypothetical protein